MQEKEDIHFYTSDEVAKIIENDRPDIIEALNESKIYDEMAYALIKARIDKKLTQEELSKLSGLSQVQISRMENGKIGSLKTLLKLLNKLDLTIKIVPTIKK